VPATPEATEQLVNRIAFIRETHCEISLIDPNSSSLTSDALWSDGKFWDFTSDLARGDTAYSTMALAAHTDNTYFVRSVTILILFLYKQACFTQTDPCGVQIFHLLEHTSGTGGASLLVDGFYVASILRDLYPDAYGLLSTVPIPFHAAGESGSLYRASHTPFEHDTAGNLRAVRWNNDDRSVLRNVPYADVPRLYEAMRTWNKLITSQDSEYWVQLSPGTVIGAFSFFLPPPHLPLLSLGFAFVLYSFPSGMSDL
jgi:trimethyllysine dioxygenase